MTLRLLAALCAAAALAAGCGSDDDSATERLSAGKSELPDAFSRPERGFEVASRFDPNKLDRYRYRGVIAHVGNIVVAGPGTPLEEIVERCGGEITQAPSVTYMPEPDGHNSGVDQHRPYMIWVCAPARTAH